MRRCDLSDPVKNCLNKVHTLLHPDETIEEGIARLRHQKISDRIIYFYVVSSEGKLVGVVSTRKLLLSDPKSYIRNVMQSGPLSIHQDKTLQEALKLVDKHKILALPVIDDFHTFLGSVDVDAYTEEFYNVDYGLHRNDLFQLLGITLEEGTRVPLWRIYRFRMPWLFCNMIGGLICAVISRVNEHVLTRYILLAFFIPLILTLSESISMQSMTQSLHFLRRPTFTWPYAFHRGFREWGVVSFIAISCGVIIGAVSGLWGDGVMPSITIGVGITLSMIVSAAFAMLIPIFLHRLSLDPKIASGPVVLMLTDILTTLFYFSIATWWLL